MENSKREQNRLYKLASEYRGKGYNVFMEPGPSVLPKELSGFRPDMIAISDSDKVVIEVKSNESSKPYDQINEIAKLVDGLDDWRFEFVITNPRSTKNAKSSNTQNLISKDQIQELFDKGEKQLNNEEYEAAFIMYWVVIEAYLRTLYLENYSNKPSKSANILAKELFSSGLMNRSDYDDFTKVYKLRNRFLHGEISSISIGIIQAEKDIIETIQVGLYSTKFMDFLELIDPTDFNEVYQVYNSISNLKSNEHSQINKYSNKIQISLAGQDEPTTFVEEELDTLKKVYKEELMQDMEPEDWFYYKKGLQKN